MPQPPSDEQLDRVALVVAARLDDLVNRLVYAPDPWTSEQTQEQRERHMRRRQATMTEALMTEQEQRQ